MRLINSIVSITIILFFAAVLYVGYKAVSYYNDNAGKDASLTTALSESTGEAIAEAKDFTEEVEEAVETTKTALEETQEEGIDEFEEEINELEEEAEDENLAEDETLEKKEAITKIEAIVKKVPEKNSEKKPDNYSEKALTNKKNISPKTIHAAYMVIAGTFSTKQNAQIVKNKLGKLDYTPEIVQFRGSKLYVVIAERVASLKVANLTVNRLKAEGIEAYARKRRAE